MMVTTIAPLVAPLLGGQILKLAGWQALFLFLAVVAAVIFVIAVIRIKETLQKDKRSKVPVSH